MVRALRTSSSGRLGAVIVALTMTGAPALAARPESGEHRCLCRAHARDDDCECARCHEATSKQRQAADAQRPPCHRAAAKDGKHAPQRRSAGAPCVTGTCGGPETHGTPLTPLDAFTLSLAPAPSGALPPAGSVERPSGAQREAPSVPEIPPP
jgi:hypothetical protein